VVKVDKLSDHPREKKRLLVFIDGSSLEVDELLWAIGRAGQTADLKLDRIGVS
jgi:pyruvate/2-oxoglutarate dehydrogenase complex dihydrolipoamide dehydrogenase (E3) component